MGFIHTAVGTERTSSRLAGAVRVAAALRDEVAQRAVAILL